MKYLQKLVIVFLLCLSVVIASGGERTEAVSLDVGFEDLGVFDFDFGRLGKSVPEQFDALEGMGYAGITLSVNRPPQLKKLVVYQQELRSRSLQLYAGYLVARLTADNTDLYAQAEKAAELLAKSESALWIIIQTNETGEVGLVAAIDRFATIAQNAGVELVLYPHDNCAVETAEGMLAVVETLDHQDIGISLHLCHEIRGGNGDRLTEVAQALGSRLRLPSISGADSESAMETKEDGWARGIRPLDQGDYDSSKLLSALEAVGYNGPVILHTFGLQKVNADHHQRSIERYRAMQLER